MEQSPVYQVVGAVHVKSRWIYAIGEPCAEHSGTQASGWMLEMSGWAKTPKIDVQFLGVFSFLVHSRQML
jgi:hypothetical protein